MSEQTVRRVRRQRPIDARTGESVLVVTASGFGIDTKERRDVIDVSQFATEPAYIRVSAGVTKKLADYESLRVDVALSVPCYVEEMDSMYDKVAAKVSDLLTAEVEAYLGES